MRRRNLFTLAAGASAVLCVAVCVLWVRSCLRCDSAWWRYGAAFDNLASTDGRIVFSRMRYQYGPHLARAVEFETSDRWDHDPLGEDQPAGRLKAFGFEWSDDVDGTQIAPVSCRFVPRYAPLRLRIVAVPWWAIAALAAALPLRAARLGWCGRRRTQAGSCASCGYDLRATPDRCPECGAVPVGTKSAISNLTTAKAPGDWAGTSGT